MLFFLFSENEVGRLTHVCAELEMGRKSEKANALEILNYSFKSVSVMPY